ncbi:MAG: zinc-ribbon domain-containing protein [Longimicrobiaceae bacterium]
MNVTCSHCETVFRVDSAKVPPGGVRARCSICRKVFDVPGTSGAPSRITPESGPAAETAPTGLASPPAAPEPKPAPAPAPVPGPEPEPRPSRAPASSPFGAADPGAKARRLARALVSDIVMYHPVRRDQAVADGRLKQEFKDEIKKSWQEYVEQMGSKTARETPHFRNALNEILARGAKVF